ncbi:hypothetical protein FRC01_006443 [Tulasnella sp. 417]|nr:hypothetical protein FRC01_006443 [Tulasnella sp. 417]
MAQSSSYLGVQYNWKPGAASSIASAASSRSSLHVATESNAITQRNQELRRKAFEKRDSNFVITHGARRHGMRKEVAPYPMNYNHSSLDIDTIDHCALWATRGGPSDFDFKEPPKRSLDLGCGHATWILETAKVWKTTHFVGFDLVKNQPDLSLHPELADRVEWVHGNLALEMAVREDQWDFVISEIVRVLKPGGAAEFLFNDILFPYLTLPPDERKLLQKAPPYEPPPPPPILPGFSYPAQAPAPSLYSQTPATPSFNANIRQQSKTLTNRARKAINNMVAQTTQDVNGHGKGRSHGGDPHPEVDDDVRSASGSGVMSASTSQLSNASSGKLSISDPQAFDASDAPPLPRVPPSIITRPSMSSHREPTPPRHVHEWLEDIFYAMFERRFINVTPTRILPNYLNIHLSGVTAGQHEKEAEKEVKKEKPVPVAPQPPKKRKRKPMKFIAASQALTMMLVRSFKVVLGCREDMFEELLLQNGLSESANGDPDHPQKAKVAALREKFDQAFDHYVSDMRDVAAIADGLVYTLGMKRPAKAALTPAQEMDERLSREKRVERTLGLIGWAYKPQSIVPLADGNRGRSGSAEHGRKSMGQLKPTPELDEEEPCLFRSTRVYAGFKRMTFTKPSPP